MKSSKSQEIIIVILLTMTSGCSDAISFLSLGQVLTAAMTGNTVFLGLSLVHAGGLKSLGFIIALSGFIIGVAVGAIVVRKKRHVTGINPVIIFTLCIELAALLIFGLFVSYVNHPSHILLIILLSFSMGVQGVVARRIGVNGVPTTVITSTTTGLIESLVWNVKLNPIDAKTSSAPLSSIMTWIIDIAIYCVGAAVCGAAVLKWQMHAIWLPATIVFVVILFSAFSRGQINKRTQSVENEHFYKKIMK